jgi:hypothetical protein
MDEIDAALDFKNVSIVGRFIKERTKNVSVFFLKDKIKKKLIFPFSGTIYRYFITRKYVYTC